MSTRHIADRGADRTLCGRPVASRRTHLSWPQCKTCLRVMKAGGPSVLRCAYDSDGWSIDPQPRATWTWLPNTTTTSSSTVVYAAWGTNAA